MQQFVLASGNKNKFEEYQAILAPFNIKLIPMSKLGLDLDGVIENGPTYAANALIKASAIAKQTHLPVLADDTGLSIAALNGFPGLNSHRFMENKSDHEKNLAVLELMKNESNRSATFYTAIVVLNLENVPLLFEGDAKGHIFYEPTGSTGFGYDSIFYSDELRHGFAEGPYADKNRVSHRAKALEKMLVYLKKHYPWND